MDRDCKHGRLARSCNECDLEREVQEQAERIRELEATEARYYALLELDSSDVMVDVLNRAEAVEQQLSEVVEYATKQNGALKEVLAAERYSNRAPSSTMEAEAKLDAIRAAAKRAEEALALPLPKAMQEAKHGA